MKNNQLIHFKCSILWKCYDPCCGLQNCETFVNGTGMTPLRNNQLATVTSTLNYKFSVDILCNMAPDGNWNNIIHVTTGENTGTIGARTFLVHTMPSENSLLFVTTYDDSDDQMSHKFSCNTGEWNTYSVEVRQVDGSSTLRSVMSIDGIQVQDFSYDASHSPNGEDLFVFASNDFIPSAPGYSVRNFFYQTF